MSKRDIVDQKKGPKGWGTRHTFTIMMFMGFLINQLARSNLSVAIVAMVQHNGSTSDIGYECPFPSNWNETTDRTEGDFDWDAQEQGVVLGAYFYGFFVTMLPGGYCSERYGGKIMILLATLGSSLCSLISPLAARQGGQGWLVAVRALQGFLNGPVIPTTISMAGRWIPASERSKLISFIWAGTQAGTVIGLVLGGFLSEYVSWDSNFYFIGAAGIIYCIFWQFICFDGPATHPRISQEEKEFIIEATQSTQGKLPPPPFKHIFASVPFWTLAFTFLCFSWGFFTLISMIPTYLNNIQHIPLSENGILSATPYLLNWVFAVACGWIADYFISSGKLSRAFVRKSLTLLGCAAPGAFLIALSFIKCNPELALTCLCLGCFLNGASYSGFNINSVELSPNYAGTLRGLTSTLANTNGFSAPAFVGSITNGHQDFEHWQIVFLVAGFVYLCGGSVFAIFGQTHTQPWNTYWEVDKIGNVNDIDANPRKPSREEKIAKF